MISKPTLQTLPLECLLEILLYVPLPECMFLRSSCSHLKTAVDDHFRFKVRALSLVLTARYSFQKSTQYEKVFEEGQRKGDLAEFEKITFGSTSGVSKFTIWEKKYVFETRFRFENCIVLFSWAKFDRFVKFIARYMPNITKLGLLFDCSSYLDRVPVILNLYRKQLKVLLMKVTTRSGVKINSDLRYIFARKEFELPNEVYNSVVSLDALEKLYFFCRSWSDILYGDIGSTGQQFVETMFRKLRVLHIGSDMLVASDFRFWSKLYKNLEELSCEDHEIFRENTSIFPRLEKLILNSRSIKEINMLTAKSLPNLKELVIFKLFITPEILLQLGSFSNLKQIHCGKFSLKEDEDYGNIEPNRTLKCLEIDCLELNEKTDSVTHSTDVLSSMIKAVLPLFLILEKIVIREPPMELIAADFEYLKAYVKPDPVVHNPAPNN